MKKNILFVIVFFISLLGILEYNWFIWHTTLFTYPYEIEWIDISHYQWDIDWKKVSEENNYSFVYMKATEWHDYVDDTFEINWKEAKEQSFNVWAYHFFSMRSTWEEQAKYFISIVPIEKDNLPPVIDVEISNNHNVELVQKELLSLSKNLESYYWKRPILYVTYDTYNTYIKNKFLNHELWFRDIVKKPSIGDREWLFWQYSNRWRIKGIEWYVDKNVFNWNKDKFLNFLKELEE